MTIFTTPPNDWVASDLEFDQAQANISLKEKYEDIDTAFLLKADKLRLRIALGAVPDEQIDIDADSLKLFNASFEFLDATAINLTADNTASGANGLDAGVVAIDTWYSVWVIGKADGTIASLLHAGGTGVIGDLTFPAGYTYARRVAWVLTDGTSDFILGQWFEQGMSFKWDGEKTIVNINAVVYTDVDCSNFLPPDANTIWISCPRTAGDPGLTDARLNGNTNDIFIREFAWTELGTDDNQIFEFKSANAQPVDILTYGYKLNGV